MKADNKAIITLPVMVLGFTSLVTQIILLREFMSVFFGNELVMGIVLANWMLLTGLGALLGRFSDKVGDKPGLIIILQILTGLLPAATVIMMSVLRNVTFPVGSMISFTNTFFSTFLLLMPYCLLSGFLFTLFCNYISGLRSRNAIPGVYSSDVLGSIIGGLLFNLLFIFFLKTFQSLIILMIINLLSALVISAAYKRHLFLILISFFILLISYFMLPFNKFDIDILLKAKLYPGQEIVYQKDTPYGNIVITRTGEQHNFYENGVFLYSTKNTIQKEEDVHYAMLQHSSPENVLLISGGISGTTDEILKYDVKRIDYLEINPSLVEIAKDYNPHLNNPKINIINQDAIIFLKKQRTVYDIALINVPPPETAQLNRFYTIEFYRNLKQHLRKDAVVSVSLMATSDYVSNEAKEINAVIYNTLKAVFRNVLIVPGGKNYFIASDNYPDINIAALVIKRKIQNDYVNQYYIQDDLLRQRSDYILKTLTGSANSPSGIQRINRDLKPIGYFSQLQYRLSFFRFKILDFRFTILLIVLIVLLLIIVFKIQNLEFRIQFSLFTTGFTASSMQFLMLIYFQVMYGYVYMMTGILITLFMAGLAAGTYISRFGIPAVSSRNYTRLVFVLGLYSIAVPFILMLLDHYTVSSRVIQLVYFMIVIDIGTLTGMIFAFAVYLQKEGISQIASRSYSSDMLGSAIGVLLVSSFLLPLLGLVNVSILIGLINLGSGTLLMIRRNKA